MNALTQVYLLICLVSSHQLACFHNNHHLAAKLQFYIVQSSDIARATDGLGFFSKTLVR
jgi:hypothetical protein